jgi:hypothetical protein
MSLDDVYRESLHDWLDEREDNRPDPSEYREDHTASDYKVFDVPWKPEDWHVEPITDDDDLPF